MDSLNFIPPLRRSLNDAQLSEALNQPHTDEASILSAMQLLESQSELRADDIRSEEAWIQEMQSLNSPQSLAALALFKSGGQVPSQVPATSDVPVPSDGPAASDVSAASHIPDVNVATASQQESASTTPQVTETLEPQVPLSLFDQIASHEKAAPQVESRAQELGFEAPIPVLPEANLFPLVQIAPEPDISVLVQLPEPTLSSIIDGSVEQQITEVEEKLATTDPQDDQFMVEGGHDDFDSVDDLFENLVAGSPVASTEYTDDARSMVSTAHRASSNEGASALFFNWLPIGGSVLPVALAVYVHSLGLALTDAVVAVAMATFAAFATTTSGAIAGKRAGLPTFVVSRATFGVYGARLPSAFFAIIKLVSASVMVLLLVVASQDALTGWSVEGPTATRWMIGPVSVALWQVIVGVSVILVAVTSFIKLRYIKFLNLLVGVVSSAGVVGSLAWRLAHNHSLGSFEALRSWPMTLGASALVFAALGSVWSSSGADFASILKKSTKGSQVIGWSALSLFLIPTVIACATLSLLDSQMPEASLLGVSSIVPALAAPYAYGVFAAVVLLLAALELRSTRLAVRGIYSRFSGAATQIVLALAFVAISLAEWHFYSTQGLLMNLRDYALVVSVPVTAWLGIFASDSLMRRIAYHDISLTRSYGFYGNFNVINLFGWVLASAAGLGMLSSTLPEFNWVGFLARYSVNPSFWAQSNLGVAAAFAIGVLFPLCFGVPRIRRQEAEVLSIESRRYELRDVLATADGDQFEPFLDATDDAI
jgi:purine-cytosine permease-like protein